MSFYETLGVQSTSRRGEVVLTVMTVCTCLVIADILNIFDGVGLVKKLSHKTLPAIFGEDKFRSA